jgi:hypothetical protein
MLYSFGVNTVIYEKARTMWGVLLLPKRDSDKDFLERMDKAWGFLFTVATVALLSVVAQLLVDIKMHIIVVFVGALVLPAVVEVWGIISNSAKVRFYSWAMVIVCIVAVGMIYLYGFVWLAYVKPILVPSVMDLFSFVLIFNTVDTIIVIASMTYGIGRLIRHFGANLKSKSHRIQIPIFRGWLPFRFLLLFTFYVYAEYIPIWFLLHSGGFNP